MTPELYANIAIWRQKALNNELTEADMTKIILALRNGRMSAAVASDTARAKKAKADIPSADDLLNEMEGL